MSSVRTQRVRDPVHGLIVFREDSRLDQLAWSLVNTPPFQRLRRIKQLGFSEFVFPGATHSRFVHCLGVFHTARQLIDIIHREQPSARDDKRAEVAVLAALLHDIGHGPFSHVFETVERSRGAGKGHEQWSAEIVLSPDHGVWSILEGYRPGLAGEIADLLRAETPVDVYHAVVSSSFDADRLDYLRRDRLMTGTGAGAIDFDWLLDNLTVANIDIGLEPTEESPSAAIERPSFCLKHKALQAAEGFLLARYHLYMQVYLHKTTRCIEQMLGLLLRRVSQLVQGDRASDLGLGGIHPIVAYYRQERPSLSDYLSLDDVMLWSAVGLMQSASDPLVHGLATRLWQRDLFKAVDVTAAYGDAKERQRRASRWIETYARDTLGRSVLKDEPKVGIYGEIGADDTKAHKRLMILMPDGGLNEITEASASISAIKDMRLIRYCFEDRKLRDFMSRTLEERHV